MTHDHLRDIFDCWSVDVKTLCEDHNMHFNHNFARVLRDVMNKYVDNEDALQTALDYKAPYHEEARFHPIQQLQENAQLEYTYPKDKYGHSRGGNIFSLLLAFDLTICPKCHISNCSLHQFERRHYECMLEERVDELEEVAMKCNKNCNYTCFSRRKNLDNTPECTEMSEDGPLISKLAFNLQNICDITKVLNARPVTNHRTCASVYREYQYILENSEKVLRRPELEELQTEFQAYDVQFDVPDNYEPCGCIGMFYTFHVTVLLGTCTKDCPCHLRSSAYRFCSSTCSCALNCKLRYKGCSCKQNCRTPSCSCYSQNRECDTSLCHHCDNDLCCGNRGIQMGLEKPLAIIRSKLHGHGAMLMENVGANELICEYVGEVTFCFELHFAYFMKIISHSESERRFLLHTESKNLNYLFNVTKDFALDAMFMGNRSRFINHGKNNNCRSAIMFVLGEYRVGIYAKKAMEKGTELILDYQFTTNDTKKMKKDNKEMKKKKPKKTSKKKK